MSAPGVYLARGVPSPGGCLLPGGVPGRGMYLVPGDVCSRGVYLVRYSPRGQTDACRNITFKTSLQTVKNDVYLQVQ